MLKAFHGTQETKDFYLNRVREHARLDEIIKGTYWQDGKGCAVGCAIHSSDHSKYETDIGIPEWLAKVEDTIFEGLPNARAKLWPEQFFSAINIGADLEQIKTPFLIIVLESCLKSMDSCVYDAEKFPDVKLAINQSREAVKMMIKAHREGSDLSAAASAARSAESAAWSAESAARSAARSAAWSAAWSAESAAWSAESAAWSAARSAESAAWSAAWSAAAQAVLSAAWSATYEHFADRLLELLKECQ